MQTAWQKFLMWTKFAVLGLVIVHAMLFVFLNLSAVVSENLHLIYKTYDRPNFLLVMLLISVFSIFGWWMFWLVFRTVRQLRDSGSRSRANRLEREVADMKAKAAMLQTRPDVDPANSKIIQ